MMEASDQIIAVVGTYALRVFGALVILFVGWKASHLIQKLVVRATSKIRDFDLTLQVFLGSLARYGVMVFTILAVLNQFGVQTASLIALLGAAGLAVGLALQGTLSHVASGVMLLLFRPFKIGQYIEVAGHGGTVSEISLFTTTINTPQNVRIIIPNGQVWDQSIVNYNANDTRRVDLNIGVAYDTNLTQATDVLKKVAVAHKLVLKDPAPVVAKIALSASSIDLQVRAWVRTKDYWDAYFDLMQQCKEALDAAAIEIPFPQQVIHYKSDASAESTKQVASKKKTA